MAIRRNEQCGLSFTRINAQVADAGNYTWSPNSCGCTGDVAVLTVNAPVGGVIAQ
jgi:hypothetical protein